MPHKNFNPPADALDVLKVMDWDVFIAQNSYQHAPGNYETYHVQAVNPTTGKLLELGNPKTSPATEQCTWPRSPWDALQRIVVLISRQPPKAIHTIPVPDYLGFRLHVEHRTAKRHPKSRRYYGKASREFSFGGVKVPVVVEAYGASSQFVVNELRKKVDRLTFYIVYDPRGGGK